MLTTQQVGMLYEEAKHRLGRRPPGYDLARVPDALVRLQNARDDMLDPKRQRAERERWQQEGWQKWITTQLTCAVNITALERYAATSAANHIPVNKHGIPYWATERHMIETLLQHVTRQPNFNRTPQPGIGNGHSSAPNTGTSTNMPHISHHLLTTTMTLAILLTQWVQ